MPKTALYPVHGHIDDAPQYKRKGDAGNTQHRLYCDQNAYQKLGFPATMLSHCKVFFCFIGTASFLFFRAGHGTTAPLRAGRTNRTTDAHTAGSADP